jgi:hypothetical protein
VQSVETTGNPQASASTRTLPNPTVCHLSQIILCHTFPSRAKSMARRFSTSGSRGESNGVDQERVIFLGFRFSIVKRHAELVSHVAPVGWEHIAFNGDYVRPAEPLGNAFRPLRNPRAEFLDAA